MFTKEDFKVNSAVEVLEFVPIVLFIGLIAPFLIAAYTVGFVLNVTGKLNS